MLEQAVTWIIILIVVVFDPLAVIMLLAAQMTFGWSREQKEPTWIDDQAEELTEAFNTPAYEPDDGPLSDQQIEQIKTPDRDMSLFMMHDDLMPLPELFPDPKPEPTADQTSTVNTTPVTFVADEDSELAKWNKMIEEAERQVAEESTMEERLASGETYINEQGVETPLDDESKKKTYMTKNEQGQMEIKNR
jgi:hypothetical protein